MMNNKGLKKNMKALILAGGTGSRLRPLTHTGAKQLLPVANKPIIFYGLEDIINVGIRDIGIIVGKETINDIKKVVGNGKRWGVNIEYIYQEEPLGLAHCVKISEDFLANGPFVMYLGDNILKSDLSTFVEESQKSDVNSLILLSEVENPKEFGVVELNKKGEVKRLIEKPKEPPSNLALVGIYIFDKNIFKAVNKIKPSWRNELEITDAIQWLIDNGYKVLPHKVQGWWKDTGKPEDILEANRLILNSLKGSMPDNVSIDSNSKIEGEVKLDKGVKIENSVIRGPVTIGEKTLIINSYIGPYTSIYCGCTIINSEIENSIIMKNTRISDISNRLDGCLIGEKVEIEKNMERPTSINLILGDRSKLKLR
jgi:glucose-1-phosphate thymidylyltransferase